SPTSRNVLATGTIVDVAAYNRKLLSPADVPKTWEDFLRPQHRGRKIIVDIRPNSLAGLFPAMGKEWVLDYARKLAAQEPVWVRGRTRALTSLAAGEYPLFLGTYYHAAMRLKRRGAADLEVILLEPVPVRITETYGVVKGARHSRAALLFLEYATGSEGQRILDDVEPLKSSIFSPDSKLEQLVRGRKTSVIDWDHVEKQGDYMEQVFKAYGMPRGEK
ncbi:MAG: ABC transporter substrate-binding protein, partial [Candidatus Binatia bacterium]